MKLEGYYSSGEFAKMAHVSIRTIRFYDKQNILKPSHVNESGARFYTDSDFARLQQILLLKYLGFSLDDIKEMLVSDLDHHFLKSSLQLQKKLVLDRLEQMQLVANAIDDTVQAIENDQEIDWSRMLDLIHLTEVEKSLKTQYENASNVSARIRLHTDFSTNKMGWFPWIYESLTKAIEDQKLREAKSSTKKTRILELGCGDGSLWVENCSKLPSNYKITLSDISEGMIRDARRNISAVSGSLEKQFGFKTFDCNHIPYPDNSFDCVIANHLLFYCDDITAVCTEIARVLAEGGIFICSTYGHEHMKEISQLVEAFDGRIALSAEKLYERFGLNNGANLLTEVFSSVNLLRYEDEILLYESSPLIEYILSCHGNQNQYLLSRYHDFSTFVEKKTKNGFHITKDAGLFVCIK